jgi:FtsP/CotA-like multicopper oxidase with cupredoxin domain
MQQKKLAKIHFALIAVVCTALLSIVPAALAAQVPLPGASIPKYVDPLPELGTTDVTGGGLITVTVGEAQQPVLPASIYAALPAPYNAGTWVWQYSATNTVYNGPRQTYLGPVIVAKRGTPVTVKYENTLGDAGTSQVIAYRTSVDQTIHWADPLGQMMQKLFTPYAGPIPIVTHLHGGEVPSAYDGGPDSWFTKNLAITGPGYVTDTYTYPNGQEGAPLWYHDHALGVTRLQVYAGLAGAYLLTDPANGPANLPPLVPLVIQDRIFDTNGQLYFPNVGINPTIHPFWIPEFFGDAIVVNGKSWPYLQVEPKRYLFFILNGSNARFYDLMLKSSGLGGASTPLWAVGTDGGYLDKPVMKPSLLIAPGERYLVIVDFAGFAGQTLTLSNRAKAPFPSGTRPDPKTVAEVIQFRVNSPLAAPDTSYNPATGTSLRLPMVRLVNPATGTLAAGVTANKTRELTLNEIMGPAGPQEILVNNSKWNGALSPNAGGITELPQVGATEVWEIVNLTADAHPIHLHLVQFQLLNRQPFQANKYIKAYNAAFPGGTSPVTGLTYPAGQYIPGYGPPLPYLTTAKLGGNPDVTPYLQSAPTPPLPHEAGWKDTFIMYPGQVTRVAVRWAPQAVTVNAVSPGTNLYSFDPTLGPGYVWHCHILDHEDNEMMRPYKVSFTAQ